MSAVANAAAHFKQMELDRSLYHAKYGQARLPVSALAGDKRMIVIGGSIYTQVQEGPYEFMNVLHDCGLELFGEEMLEEQEKLPLEERHPALQWMQIFVDHHQEIVRLGKTDLADTQIGAGAAWFRFGYDLFTIRDNSKLQREMKKRLLNVDGFQAARHELAVAALFVAAGFEIEYQDEKKNDSKHPEFIATDKKTGLQVAVEAKSRRRRGVKGFKGGHERSADESVGIRSLVTDAFSKGVSIPFYVFVDVNLGPASTQEKYASWLLEIDQTMRDLALEGYAKPCAANGVFFSNDPSHYILNEPISSLGSNLWIKDYCADIPSTPHPSIDLIERLLDAYSTRVTPPRFFPNFT